MSSVFVLLALLSIGGLVWGLAAPHQFAKILPGSRKPTRKRIGLSFAAFAIVFLVLGGATAPPHPSKSVQLIATTSNKVEQATTDSAQVKGANTTATTTTKQVQQTVSIPFTAQAINSASLPKGQSKITQIGINGTETDTYNVTYVNNVETTKTLLTKVVTVAPTAQITTVGTYIAPAPVNTPAPVVTSPSPVSCYPLTNGGNCYEPGEYCRATDHGASGVAGDGKRITCLDNNGYRWEPN